MFHWPNILKSFISLGQLFRGFQYLLMGHKAISQVQTIRLTNCWQKRLWNVGWQTAEGTTEW